MLDFILPDYSRSYKITWQLCVGLNVISLVVLLIHQGCYSQAVASPMFKGIPWTTVNVDESVASSLWGTEFCKAALNIYNPALVDAIVIALPATCLILVSLLLQLIVKRPKDKLPEMTILGLLLMTVVVGCMSESLHINSLYKATSYPSTSSWLTYLFCGCYLAAYISTIASVVMIWPQPPPALDSPPQSPEGEPIVALPLRDMFHRSPPAAGDGGPDSAGQEPPTSEPSENDRLADLDILTGVF